jgi:amino acid adenylation domain-containing protein
MNFDMNGLEVYRQPFPQQSTEQPPDMCIHQLFEEQVRRTPDRVAVVFADQHLTYEELNQRAHQLACYLRRIGIGPGIPVGICLHRSLEMIIAVFAVLNAEGFYIPLDPSYPHERLSFMLKDSAVPIVITHSSLQQIFCSASTQSSPQVLCIDQICSSLFLGESENLPCEISAIHPAYAIYTSGSTGRPKGVLVEHHSVVNLASGLYNAIYAHIPETPLRVSLNGSLSFDTSVKQLIQLLFGHTLYILPEMIRFDGEALATFLSSRKIDVFDCTPSQLRILLEESWLSEAAVPFPRCILVGGEAIDEMLWRRLAQYKTCQFYNVYGPTECTVDATICQIQSEDVGPNIGFPILNVEVYILDTHLHPVPMGVPGEIYISGAGLTRGYLNRPDLTAQAFLPNPFSKKPGARMYKTGDLGRLLSDGAIEMLGRIDQQVKVRGFRIELGEIECALAQHPAVRQCVVIAHPYRSGEMRLIAYVISQPISGSTLGELRQFLQSKLPEYMLPSSIVILETIPLTPNGKLDRQALPIPDLDRPELDVPFMTPRTPAEEMLAGIWANVLGLKQIGVYDNFFELGGHSLLLTQLISRVRRAFQVEVPLAALFGAPTIANLAQFITTQMDFVAKESGLLPSIQPVARDRDLPLTFAQERVWFLQCLYPESRAYYFRTILRFRGQLDIRVLEQTLTEIIRRHESFRTTFHEGHEWPVQRIHVPWSVSLPYVDLRALPEKQRRIQEEHLVKQEFQHMFHPDQLPLIRWALLQLDDYEYTLVQVEHHLIHDGWSFNVFLRELKELYEAFSQGKSSPLDELPIQVADFACWQREWIQGEEAKGQLAYWKQKLEDSPPTLALPTDHPRPPVQRFRGSLKRIEIGADLARSLRTLSRDEGVTLFMTMLAAFQLLLYRYTNQEDILIGSGIANRRWQETEGLIGMIINTLAYRAHFANSLTFRELIQQIRQSTLEAYAHQDLPFEEVVKVLHPERNLGSNPLIQVMFSFHNAPLPDLTLPNLTIEVLDLLDNGSAKFDLAVIAIPRAEQSIVARSTAKQEGITLLWEYNTDLFDEQSMIRMVQHYQMLLEGIVASPEKPLSELPLLTIAEQQQLLVTWNATSVEYPKDQCIHHLFEAQVLRTPEAIAVTWRKQQLTYQELNARANQLAHYLRDLGVKRGELVGICLERSIEMIIGFLGVLKAGGGYVPLDPSYPPERLAFMLADSQASVLVTESSTLEQLSAYTGQIVYLDVNWPIINRSMVDNPDSAGGAENVAYMIYTSGSTGRPKGAGVYHRGVVNLLHWFVEEFQISADDTSLIVTSHSFDLTQKNIFAPLTVGGKVALFGSNLYDVAALCQNLCEQSATLLNCTPSAFYPLLEYAGQSQEPFCQLTSLRHLFLGGEPIISPKLQNWLHSPICHAEIVNTYGPTECTDIATFYRLPRGRQGSEVFVPIGKPIWNVKILILDQDLRLVPIGVVGELCILGDGLGTGYIRDSALTAMRFSPHPYTNECGPVLYRTGDIARYRPDGNIELLGRMDQQIKIRGFRVEPGEIEAILRENVGVQDCVVMVQSDVQGIKRLLAYIVPVPERSLSPSGLRHYLAERLPDYMIPSAFIPLTSLPLTANGKLDKNALPVPSETPDQTPVGITAPGNLIELHMTNLFEDILGVHPVGITQNFFDLGGHSLAAVRLMNQIKSTFGLDLPLTTLFQAQTVESLAALLRNQASPTPRSALVAIQPRGTRLPFYCVHPIGGEVLCFVPFARHLGIDQPFYGLQENKITPPQTLEEYAEEYIRALRTHQPEGPYKLGGYSFGGLVAFEMALQLQKQGQEVSLLALLDTRLPPLNAKMTMLDDETILRQAVQGWMQYLERLAATHPLSLDHPITFLSAEILEQQSLDEQVRYYLKIAKELQAEQPDTQPQDILRYLWDTLASRRAALYYMPEGQFWGSIHYFKVPDNDNYAGWNMFSSEPLTVYQVVGTHNTLMEEPHVAILAKELYTCLT